VYVLARWKENQISFFVSGIIRLSKKKAETHPISKADKHIKTSMCCRPQLGDVDDLFYGTILVEEYILNWTV
jgi:hypothetical protein